MRTVGFRVTAYLTHGGPLSEYKLVYDLSTYLAALSVAKWLEGRVDPLGGDSDVTSGVAGVHIGPIDVLTAGEVKADIVARFGGRPPLRRKG